MWNKLNSLPLKTKLNIHYLLCVTGSLFIIVSSELQNIYPLLIIGGLILTLGLVFRILLIKCPYCGDGLYQRYADLKTCPKCGKKIS